MTSRTIKLAIVAAAFGSAVALPAAAEARSTPPLRNPALLNIGFVCQWQSRCIRKQQSEMKQALRYVKKSSPPAWKVQLCNRNSSRNGTRKDWVGFNNCIRNPALRAPPARRRGR
jgi:hypothetical protein